MVRITAARTFDCAGLDGENVNPARASLVSKRSGAKAHAVECALEPLSALSPRVLTISNVRSCFPKRYAPRAASSSAGHHLGNDSTPNGSPMHKNSLREELFPIRPPHSGPLWASHAMLEPLLGPYPAKPDSRSSEARVETVGRNPKSNGQAKAWPFASRFIRTVRAGWPDL